MTKILLCILCLIAPIVSQAQKNFNQFEWSESTSLPSPLGLAAPYAGVSNGAVIVTGGCNFPNTSVRDGGAKVYYSDIYVLPKGEEKWIEAGKMAYASAYGASVNTNEGLLCIGGNNADGALSKTSLLKWTGKSVEADLNYPDLPMPLTGIGATIVDDIVYLVGADSELNNVFLSLDLSRKGSEIFKWEKQEPYPGKPRTDPLVIAQNAAESVNVYIFGGFSFASQDNDPHIATSGLTYNTKTKEWKEAAAPVNKSKGELYALIGAAVHPVGKNHILAIGGVDRSIFTDALTRMRQVEAYKKDSPEAIDFERWRYNYFSQTPEEFEFNSDVLIYNTILDQWSVACEYPFTPPAGAKIVNRGDEYLVINGETMPGVRSPKVYSGKLLIQSQFGLINWIVLVLYLAGMLLLGFSFMKKSQATDDFFRGGGRIPWWAIGISLFATMLSAITFMAIPAKTFATDWKYFPMAITILVMAFPVITYYLPFFKRLNVISAYEYLEKRFNYAVRFMASSLFIVFMLSRIALTLFLPSLALTTVTGIDIFLCIVLMGVITLAYCTMGGVEAVVWSDVIQGAILLGGAVFAIIFLAFNIDGGFQEIISISIDNDKLRMFDLSPNMTSATLWVILLGGLANNLITYTSDQTAIQRYISTNSEKEARKTILLNGVISIVISVVFYFIGTALYVFYKQNPSALNYAMQNTDAIFPHYIMAEIPVGMAGLMIAAIFAATMSTISSNINSLSTAFTIDMYCRFKPLASDAQQLKAARVSGVVVGGLGIGLAILMASWNILSLFDFFNFLLGLLSSGVAALFFMGIFMPRIGANSAFVGFVMGNISLILISTYTNLSFMLYGFIGIVCTLFFALLASLLFKNKRNSDGLTWKTLKK